MWGFLNLESTGTSSRARARSCPARPLALGSPCLLYPCASPSSTGGHSGRLADHSHVDGGVNFGLHVSGPPGLVGCSCPATNPIASGAVQLSPPPQHLPRSYTLLATRFAVGLGSLMWGPISDRWGRRYCLYASTIVYLGFATGCVFSKNISEWPPRLGRKWEEPGGRSSSPPQ
jgi:hypothetical protein